MNEQLTYIHRLLFNVRDSLREIKKHDYRVNKVITYLEEIFAKTEITDKDLTTLLEKYKNFSNTYFKENPDIVEWGILKHFDIASMFLQNAILYK